MIYRPFEIELALQQFHSNLKLQQTFYLPEAHSTSACMPAAQWSRERC